MTANASDDDVARCPAAASPQGIDMSVLANLVDEDRSRMRLFAQRFLLLAREDMLQFDAALARQDRQGLASLGHHNIGSASIVGATGFARLCQALEKHGDHGEDMEQARRIVSQMHATLDRISAQIDQTLT